MKRILLSLAALWLLGSASLPAAERPHKLIIIAGRPSHPPLMHEFRAGSLLLQKCLQGVPNLVVEVHTNGWINTPNAFDGADAVFIYADGGAKNPAVVDDHLEILRGLVKKGVGIAFGHYGVEVLKDQAGKEFKDWIGGYYENAYSVNPMWAPEYKTFPKHPITRGVKPFSTKDEWYFNIRFRDNMEGVTPILVAKPSDETRDGPYVYPKGPYPHIQAAKGREEVMMWTVERPDGGRGFGFVGGHSHLNWANDNERKVLLNALVWLAKLEVPPNGVESTVTQEDLMKNLDVKPAPKPAPVSAPAPKSTSSTAQPKFNSGLVKAGAVPVEADIADAKSLYLVVTDGGNGIGCDWADWAEPKLVRADGSSVALTDFNWKAARSGWGQVRKNLNAGGGPLRIAGVAVPNGIGVHAPSVIEFDIAGRGFVRLQGKAGIDNGGSDQNCGSSVEFMVFTEPPPEALTQTSTSLSGSPFDGKSGPEAAKEFLKSFTVATGLEVSLFASEPMIVNPADMDIDSRGRIWVTEGANYRKWANPPLRPEGDRVVVLEDSNGAGAADKATTFYQDPSINTALGVCVLGNKVIVSCAPNVFVLTDTDGDGVADKREILFTGISGVQHDHAIHTFTFGPDGKLYFNFGNAGGQLRRPTGKLTSIPLHGAISDEDIKANSEPVIDLAGNEVNGSGKPYRQGMVFRCNPDGSAVESLAWNFRNNYEVAVDSFGTLWQSDNDDDGNQGVRINYVMEYGNYGYVDSKTGAGWRSPRTGWEAEIPRRHWHLNDPGVVPNLLQTGAGSPTGMAVYEGTLLPEIFRGQMIHCDAGPRVVRAYPVKQDGAGYSSGIINILTSSSTWFRPSDVCVAPDGSIYVADWNDAGVGGHAMADNVLAKMTGRVYRVAPIGAKPSVPKLNLTTAAGCVDALQSPNGATRYLAWTKLHQMQAAAEPELLKLWKGTEPRQRARALQLLARISGKEQKYIEAGLADADSDIRITALRIARQTDASTTMKAVKQLVKDASPQVRRECAIALRHSTAPDAPALWAQLALQHDGKDRWYIEALGIGADGQEDAFFAAWQTVAGANWNTAGGRDIVWRIHSKETPALLTKLIRDPATSHADRLRYFRALDFVDSPDKENALIALVTELGTK